MPTPQTEYRYPCENCGASLRFQPGQDVLVCDYCGHEQRIGEGPGRAPARQSLGGAEGEAAILADPETGRALQWDAGHKSPELVEIPLEQGLRLDKGSEIALEIRTLSCPNCGAQLELDGANHSGTCPFCATPVVTDTGTTRKIKPQGVLPFRLTEEQAHRAMEDWMGDLWFAPSGLVAYARKGEKLRGVYSPYWTFDANTQSEYSGQRGDYYYETVYVTQLVDGETRRVAQQVQKIRWRRAAGRVARRFNDVLVLASASLPRRFIDALTPWDLSHLRPYRPDYLAGLEAEGYTIPLAEGHQNARREMAGVIMNDARRDIGGDVQRVDRISTRHSAETFKHVLLPVWTAAYRYNGKSYRFVVNGQSGRVMGERPWSAWKIAGAVFAGLLALAILLYFAASNGYVDFGSGVPSPDYVIQGY
ncbi:zinc ribbon domain-containing protein [Paracoccus fistulariae]|uniref:Zinc ribbon domain-containing protein n=1 Tax=Paracoccus fistulariae TaxID=658446 RepID=A0ABY7SMC4_9RHOB|nr:zinc ribbon domain-containing protein [Paracoccus fistulariae]MDB6180061.1 zinc ribbon domain-containing protein [Paracoccus fistulariae]WCR08150.1 zinc ribbon domain-containing protein [Paracoccus fistulariae]